MISLTAKILIIIFLSTSMFVIGLEFSFIELTALLKQKRLLFKTLLANFIIVPCIGFLIIFFFKPPEDVSSAIIVLALTPGGLSAVQFASKIKTSTTYVGLIVLLMSFFSALISPLLFSLFLPKNISLDIPYQNVLIFLILFLFLPMLLGIIYKQKVQTKFKLLSRVCAVIGTLSFIAMIIVTLEMRRIAISANTLYDVITMLLFILITMFVGWIMGGPDKHDRQALAIVTSMRNVALCLAIAMKTMPSAKIITPLVSLGALMVFPNMLFTIFVTIRNKKDRLPRK